MSEFKHKIKQKRKNLSIKKTHLIQQPSIHLINENKVKKLEL